MWKEFRKINDLFKECQLCLVQGKLDESLNCFQNALELVRQKGIDFGTEASILTNIGVIYYRKGDLDKAISSLKYSLMLKETIGDKRFLVSTLMNLASSHRANSQYDDALDCLNRCSRLAKELNDATLEKNVKQEIVVTAKIKNKEPLMRIADLRIVDTRGVSTSLGNFEHLPNWFNKLTAVIDEISAQIEDDLKITLIFHFENIELEISDPYSTDKWKVDMPPHLKPRIEDGTPNLAVFAEEGMKIVEKDFSITDEEEHKVPYDYGRGGEYVWSIHIPDSYPIFGYSPMPRNERHMYFQGMGRIFYWKLNLKTRYKIEFRVLLPKTSKIGSSEVLPHSIRIGFLFPFKKMMVQTSGIYAKSRKMSVDKVLLKTIPYVISITQEVNMSKFLDFSKSEFSYELSENKTSALRAGPLDYSGDRIEVNDFRILSLDVACSEKISDPMIKIDEIDSFAKVREVKPNLVKDMVPLTIAESEVKQRLQDIIGEPFSQKDWGGERSDLFTTNVEFMSHKVSAAFLLKGKGFIRSSLTIADLGKRGDQIVRLFTEPAKIFFLQCNGSIDSQVYDMMKTYARNKILMGERIYCCVLDGTDTARILIAYGKPTSSQS